MIGLGLGLPARRGLVTPVAALGGSLSLPSGAIGVWYIDQYSTSSGRGIVPNAAAAGSPIGNLAAAPRRLFSDTSLWGKFGATVTDDAATAPDGTNDASTVVGVGNWGLHPQNIGTMPAGTYTLAVNAKRNTGSDQQFAFYTGNTGVRSTAKTATSAWQRFSYTFTLADPSSIQNIGLGSIDGSTDGNIQICDFELFSGSSDLGPQTYAGHLNLGGSAWDTKPSYAAGALDLSTGGYGLIQFPTSQSFTTITAQALVSRVGAGNGGYMPFLSKVQSYLNLSMATEISGAPTYYFNSQQPGPAQQPGLWVASGKGYHIITARYDGVTEDYFLDDIKFLSVARSLSTMTASDLWTNVLAGTGLYGGNKFAGAIALWNRALSDAEVRTAVLIQQQRAALSSIAATSAARVLVAEGDSITGSGSPLSYVYLFGPNASPTLYGVNYATSGADLSTLVARAAAIDGILPPNKTGRKFILSVLIGANGIPLDADLIAYLDARRAAGWLVVLGTITPKNGDGAFNTARATKNTTYRTWVGTHADAIADFAADATMGPDSAAADTTYYSDGLHPTAAGQAILETIYRAAVNGL